MLGILMAISAGAAMSIQGVMNTRLSDKIGLYESNMYVQGTAFVLSLIAMLILGKGQLSLITKVNPLYLFGGALGLVITLTVMLAIGQTNPSTAISVILISQLLVASLIDAFGLMETEKIPFTVLKLTGLVLMIAGVVLIKWKTA